jgi:hypothetical protein
MSMAKGERFERMVVIFEGSVGMDPLVAREVVGDVVSECQRQSAKFSVASVTLSRLGIAIKLEGFIPITDDHAREAKLVFGAVAQVAQARGLAMAKGS